MNAASIAPAVAIRRPDDRRPGARAAPLPAAQPPAAQPPAASAAVPSAPVATEAPAIKPSGSMIYTVEKGANVVPWIGG